MSWLLLVGVVCAWPPATPWTEAPPPPENDCAAYCEAMQLRCPDVFLGNRGTCLATCALYPPGEADIEKLRCRVFGQEEARVEPAPAPPAATSDTVAPPDDRWYDDHPQLRKDKTLVPEGMGALFVPSLELGDREPILSVTQDGEPAAEGRMGRRILLRPGTYTLRFGDGAGHQQIRVPVRVEAGRTTVVPDLYGVLEVDVVDPQFVPFRGTYELINTETREVVGLGFGADALLGEELKVWVIPPGVYKLVQSGGTYRDRTNFSTVRVLPGRLTRYVLVMNPDTGDFEGAGLLTDDLDPDQTWVFNGVVGGDVVFLRRDVTTGQPGWSLNLDVFLDLAERLQADPHRWVTRLEVQETQNRPAQTEQFLNLEDRLFLHTIYAYDLTGWFGPYVRVGAEVALLPRTIQFDEPREVQFTDEPGAPVREVSEVDVGTGFLPVSELIEGTGGNFRVWRSRSAELQLRVGAGARQLLPREAFVLREVDGPDRLERVEVDLVEGVESTAIGSARISRWVTLSTEFDSLYPIDQERDFIFTWRNQVNLRLASFASLTYRFNAERNPAKLGTSELQIEQDLQLRFSYTLF